MDRDLKVDREICAHFNKLVKQGAYEMGSPATRESIREILKFALVANGGWPHAIERALEAEALARELVAALQGVSGMLGIYTSRCRCGVCEYCNVQKRADKALAKAKEVLEDD